MRGSLPVTRAPDFACSIRATIRHSFFEMPQPAAVSALVETPLPAAVSALVKTSQPVAFAHWLASDLLRPGPAKEFGPRPVQHRSKMPRRRARRGSRSRVGVMSPRGLLHHTGRPHRRENTAHTWAPLRGT